MPQPRAATFALSRRYSRAERRLEEADDDPEKAAVRATATRPCLTSAADLEPGVRSLAMRYAERAT